MRCSDEWIGAVDGLQRQIDHLAARLDQKDMEVKILNNKISILDKGLQTTVIHIMEQEKVY